MAEGGANIFGIFRVKNHDFTPKNHIFHLAPPPPPPPPTGSAPAYNGQKRKDKGTNNNL